MRLLLLLLAAPLLAAAQVPLDSSHLPIVVIHTDGQTILDEPKIQARMQVRDKGPGQINRLSDPPAAYDGYIGVETRGSTSQWFTEKKPYAVETRNADGSDRSVQLLGLSKEADWVFLSPYTDKTLVRDVFAYELARRIMPWASGYRFVELVLNGEYRGIYIVAEKIKRDKNRVNIAKLDSDDLAGDSLTGGYIIKIDKKTGSNSEGWESPYPAVPGGWQTTSYQYHYPKQQDIALQQRQYIEQWMTDFEDAMDGPQFADTAEGYPKYLDVESFVDFTLINEISKNVDAYRLSTFFYKDRDSKDPRLHAGPVWDFNIGFGNVNYCAGDNPEGWAMDFNDLCGGDQWVIHFWWLKMWEDPAYRQRLATRWKWLRGGPFTDAKVMALVDSLTQIVQPAQQRNFAQWPILNEWVWPNAYCCGTYAAHVQYFRQWVLERMHWMDNGMKTLYIGEYDERKYFAPRAFPSPADGAQPVTIEFYAHYGEPVTLRVYESTGRLVEQAVNLPEFNGTGRFIWQPNLPGGLYFYEVFINGKSRAAGRVVVK
jgi:hypothetical protein